MIKLSESNFEEETRSGLVVVDFYADWCGPCKLLAPTLSQLQDAKIAKVDIDHNHKLAAEFGIASIPCLVFLKDGVEVHRMAGVKPKAAIQQKIDELK